jgi:long-subunit fatty acid transport protein
MRTSIIAATILVPAAAHAGGYLIPSAAPREVALGQAAVADQTGSEAVFLNTAALAGQEGLGIGVAAEWLSNRTDWSDPNLGSASLEGQFNTPVGVAITLGGRTASGMGWGVGVGFGVPAGGSLVWPTGWQGREAIQSVKQQVFAFGGGVALQPTPYLKLGVNFVRFQAAEELHQSLNYLTHFGDAGLSIAGGGNGFGVGVEVKIPTAPLTLAATYNHKAELDLEGEAHFEAVPPAYSTVLQDQAVTGKIIIPHVFVVGAAYEVIPNLKLMGNYEFENWSVYTDDTFIGSSGFTVSVPRNYNDAHVIRAAGEYQKVPSLPQLTVRAGVLRSISDQPRDTLSPSLTDASSWAVSLGGGFNINPSLRLDVGYQHAFFDDVTADPMSEAFQGTYSTQVDIFSLGLHWRSDRILAAK